MFRIRGDLEPYGTTIFQKDTVESLIFQIVDAVRRQQFVDTGDSTSPTLTMTRPIFGLTT